MAERNMDSAAQSMIFAGARVAAGLQDQFGRLGIDPSTLTAETFTRYACTVRLHESGRLGVLPFFAITQMPQIAEVVGGENLARDVKFSMTRRVASEL